MIATARSIRSAVDPIPEMESLPNKAIDMNSLQELIDQLEATIAPVWPLSDYVAVNPFMGMAQESFLAARNLLRQVRSGDMMMPLAHYQQAIQAGHITDVDIRQAWDECHGELRAICPGVTLKEVNTIIQAAGRPSPLTSERTILTFAEVADRESGTTWTDTVVQEISRHCAAYYDQGQALWSHPWKHLPLFTAWREACQFDRRPELLGLTAFRKFVQSLPDAPAAAIKQLLHQSDIPVDQYAHFLRCQLLSVFGWASYAKYRDGEALRDSALTSENVVGLLAIRLCYDIAIAQTISTMFASPMVRTNSAGNSRSTLLEAASRYLLLTAAEVHYRRTLSAQLLAPMRETEPPTSQPIQMLFCIDVRSEPLRRVLESLSPDIETFGFAGFFGIPLEYVPLGMTTGSSQCPVLLTPTVSIQEEVRGTSPAAQRSAVENRAKIRTWRKLWKSFQSASTSCFTFVESIGISYLTKLITDSLLLTSPVPSAKFDGVAPAHRGQLGPGLESQGRFGLSLATRLQLAEGILRNVGLTTGLGRLVVICGHASETVNNPYKAGLDCGACGGHSGESNARVAAMLLNDHEVRAGLQQRGIMIPSETWFLAALHNTTTDSLDYFDLDTLPATHRSDLQDLMSLAQQASGLVRAERAQRSPVTNDTEAAQRCRDWSEVRPEWGLAGNAAFIIAPRHRTRPQNLSGKTFLHSYNFRQDTDGKVLELIMTAPMVVASWINLQYYASSVDNQHFGSGNKTLHNVVGQFGVFEGNGGDLMTGLPWQSVFDGSQLQHNPLRLSVIIEAPRESIDRILSQHGGIRDLIDHAWISVSAIEDEQLFRYLPDRGWTLLAS